MSAENFTGNLPNKVQGSYQRPLPRDFELANNGDVSWKDETGTFAWDKMPVLPAGIFTSFDSSVVAIDQAIYIGNGDTTSVQAAWGDISQFDWVRYTADTSTWSAITPSEGQLAYDTSANVWYTYDSTTNGWLQSSQSGQLAQKNINIGDWDMVNNATLTVAHGLSATEWKTIRSIKTIIRNDANDTYYNLETMYAGDSLIDGGVEYFNSSSIILRRRASGTFDDVAFFTTSYNRGFITIEYTKD